jgi:hypothetical protein
MTKIAVFTPDQLQPILDEALIDTPEEQWRQNFKAGAAQLLKKSPVSYRAFGPFWWPLKKYLQDAGLIAGKPVDPDLFEQVTMGGETLDLAAAFAYQEHTTANLNAQDTMRLVETADGEAIEMLIIDEELEALIAAGGST